MKKILLFWIFIFSIIGLSGCQAYVIQYTDNEPFQIAMTHDEVKILQVTDLHLTYGIDSYDHKTLSLIKDLAQADDYDLIVITGDLTMSPSAPRLFTELIKYMESIKIPWTFVFGNHEADFNTYAELLEKVDVPTEYMYFKVGPQLADGGYGNFKIEFTKNGMPFYNAYFLDSKAERAVYTEEEGEYDYLSTAQVQWYEDSVSTDTVESVAFMHIPLRQMMNPVTYVGIFNEDKVYAQGVDTGFFDAMVNYGLTKAVFVGHDHKNDFYTIVDGIMLAYGRCTGFNAYGNLELGGRHIEISSAGVLSTYIVLESEVR